jgi:hypothetical protein
MLGRPLWLRTAAAFFWKAGGALCYGLSVIYDKVNQRYRRAFGIVICAVVLIAAAYHWFGR